MTITPSARSNIKRTVRSSSPATITVRARRASTPRYLGLRAAVAKGHARIRWQNLYNFGMLPLEFEDDTNYDKIEQGDELELKDVRKAIESGDATLELKNKTQGAIYKVGRRVSPRQRDMVLKGSLLNLVREELND